MRSLVPRTRLLARARGCEAWLSRHGRLHQFRSRRLLCQAIPDADSRPPRDGRFEGGTTHQTKEAAPTGSNDGAGGGGRRTVDEAVQQARQSLRQFREEAVEQLQGQAVGEAGGPVLARIDLPWPSPADAADCKRLRMLEESEWPGGVVQKFRALRPMVQELLYGYDPEFLGMLESKLDGVGLWAAAGGCMTVVANVNNATFAPFARVCRGDFGVRPAQPGHLILAVNASWTSSRDIGQLWDRELKQQAKALIDDAEWQWLYRLRVVRTSRGRTGTVLQSYGHTCQVFSSLKDDGSGFGELLFSGSTCPDDLAVSALLNECDPPEKVDRGNSWWQL